MWLNFRKMSLKRKPHIKEYQKIRKMHGEMISSMIEYLDDGKFEHKLDLSGVSPMYDENGLNWIDSEFDMDTEVGAQSFYDIVFYKTARNASCVTEDFLQKHRYRKPEKIEFLQSMLDSKPGLFEVTDTDPDEGYAYLREVFSGAEHRITDIALSGSPNFSDMYIYMRIIAFRDICFGTGLNLVFPKTDDFIQRFIREHTENYNPDGEFVRFIELYNHYTKSPDAIPVLINNI